MAYVMVQGNYVREDTTVVGLRGALQIDVYSRVMKELGFAFKDGEFSSPVTGPVTRLAHGCDLMKVPCHPVTVLNKLSAVGLQVITSTSCGEWKIMWTLSNRNA